MYATRNITFRCLKALRRESVCMFNVDEMQPSRNTSEYHFPPLTFGTYISSLSLQMLAGLFVNLCASYISPPFGTLSVFSSTWYWLDDICNDSGNISRKRDKEIRPNRYLGSEIFKIDSSLNKKSSYALVSGLLLGLAAWTRIEFLLYDLAFSWATTTIKTRRTHTKIVPKGILGGL